MDLITENQVSGMEDKFETLIRIAERERLKTKITRKKKAQNHI